MKLLLSILMFASCLANAKGGSFGGGGSFRGSSSSYSRPSSSYSRPSTSTSTFKSGSTFGATKPITPSSGAVKAVQTQVTSRPWNTPSPTVTSTPTVINHYNNGLPWYYYYYMFHNNPQPVTQSVLPLTEKCCKKGDVKCEPNLKPCVQDDKWNQSK